MRALVYLIALDLPHGTANRLLAKLAVSSLLRTWFTGDIVLLRNTPEPVFPVERRGLQEIEISDPDFDVASSGEREAVAMRWKWRARHWLKVKGYDKVVMLDAELRKQRFEGGGVDVSADAGCIVFGRRGVRLDAQSGLGMGYILELRAAGGGRRGWGM